MEQSQANDKSAMSSNDVLTAGINPIYRVKNEIIDLEIENEIQFLKRSIKIEPSHTDVEELNGYLRNTDFQEESDDEDSNDTNSSNHSQDDDVPENYDGDEKKNIAPVKSSNEILTELFKVFNVAPPEELLDDKNLIKKTKKKKKERKRKHKKQKEEGFDSHTGDGDELGCEKSKHKKSKKKHKHKHKDALRGKDKFKSKEKDKDRERSNHNERLKIDKRGNEHDKSREREHGQERSRSKENTKGKDNKRLMEVLDKNEKLTKSSIAHKRHHDNDANRIEGDSKRNKLEDNYSKSKDFYNGFRNHESSRERIEKDKTKIKSEPGEKTSRRNSDDDRISDISLSDEETYLKEKEVRNEYNKRKYHNSFYDGINRCGSRDKERVRNRGHSKDRYRDRDRERDRDGTYRNRDFRRYHSRYSRSCSRSRSRDLGIDKKRLLEIARKNAISMFKRGNLPGCDNMSEEIKDKVLLKMRYGGRTVEDLTEFCKKISNGENLSDLSSDEESDVDKAGNSKAFHHPFQLKEREPIVMHIRNSKPILPILPKTEEQTKAITMQFPVSSGQQHRLTEHWVPVESKDNLAPLPTLPTASQSTMIFKSNTPKNALGKPLPLAEEQEPAFTAVPSVSSVTPADTPTILPPLEDVGTVQTVEVSTPVVALVPVSQPDNKATLASIPTPAFIPDVPVPSVNNSVFPQANCSTLDVSSIISKRLNAMRRLQENPMDPEALKMMYNSQKEMTSWASSKHLPGQFTGSTGVNILKPNQLNSGPQVWTRRDQLTSTKPVTGGMGMQLLQKMGWRPGEGLGREKNGSLQPLLLDVKLDKRGLVAQEDCNRKVFPMKRRGVTGNPQVVQQNPEEKHPVCLLNELTSKRKWTPPLYTMVNENGPSHCKMFLFSVKVNGQTFTPNKACNTKKEAKMIAAKYCLQQIGILPTC